MHDHNPLYSLLRRQCYWFTNTIYHIVSHNYSPITQPKRNTPNTNEIYIPSNHYLPNLAGRWIGILISKVEEAVLLLLELKFKALHDQEVKDVHLSLILESRLLNSRYRFNKNGKKCIKWKLDCLHESGSWKKDVSQNKRRSLSWNTHWNFRIWSQIEACTFICHGIGLFTAHIHSISVNVPIMLRNLGVEKLAFWNLHKSFHCLLVCLHPILTQTK